MTAEQGPAGTRLVRAMNDFEMREAAGLVAGEYWNVGVAEERLVRAAVPTEMVLRRRC
jgi:hypothetical protein